MDPSDSVELKSEVLSDEEINHMKLSLRNFFRSKSNIASGGLYYDDTIDNQCKI